jgi:hypothetical protein
MVRAIACDLVTGGWTRTNQAHFPSQYIPELRQFIKVTVTQCVPERRYARVISHLEQMTLHDVVCFQIFEFFRRGDVHRPELEDLEMPAIATDASLPEEH